MKIILIIHASIKKTASAIYQRSSFKFANDSFPQNLICDEPEKKSMVVLEVKRENNRFKISAQTITFPYILRKERQSNHLCEKTLTLT